MTRSRRAAALGMAFVALVALVDGCSSPGTTSSEEPTTTTIDLLADRPHQVTTTAMTFVDATRPTPEGAGGPAEPGRTLEVWLTLPDVEGPVPLVVFSHGMAGHPRKFEQLTRWWAEAGYAVAAPAFPRSNADVPDSFSNLYDVENQPGDVSFVLDQLLALSADESSTLAGRFDPERIGASGLSAGGLTTFRVAVDDETRDPRIRAAIVMSAPGSPRVEGPDDVAVLILHGDKDPLIAPASVVTTYEGLDPPRYLITLHGGGHAGPFENPGGFEPKVAGQDELIRLTTVAFWDRYLLGIEAAGQDLIETAGSSAVATFRHDDGS